VSTDACDRALDTETKASCAAPAPRPVSVQGEVATCHQVKWRCDRIERCFGVRLGRFELGLTGRASSTSLAKAVQH
jgi:hypothetical protein